VLDDDEGSDSDGRKELSKNLAKCTFEVYSNEDFKGDEFLSQECELLGAMHHFTACEDFDD
jgi:hypothetical protein